MCVGHLHEVLQATHGEVVVLGVQQLPQKSTKASGRCEGECWARSLAGHRHTRDDTPRARTCMKYAAKMYPNTAAAHNRYLVDSAPLTTLRSV